MRVRLADTRDHKQALKVPECKTVLDLQNWWKLLMRTPTPGGHQLAPDSAKGSKSP